MQAAGVVLALLMLSWSTSALPCDNCWRPGTETEIVGDIIPSSEDIVFVPDVEDEEIISDAQPIIFDGSSSESEDGGVVVEAPQEEEIFSVALCESNPEPCTVAANGAGDDDDSSEDVEATTVKAAVA